MAEWAQPGCAPLLQRAASSARCRHFPWLELYDSQPQDTTCLWALLSDLKALCHFLPGVASDKKEGDIYRKMLAFVQLIIYLFSRWLPIRGVRAEQHALPNIIAGALNLQSMLAKTWHGVRFSKCRFPGRGRAGTTHSVKRKVGSMLLLCQLNCLVFSLRSSVTAVQTNDYAENTWLTRTRQRWKTERHNEWNIHHNTK